MAADLTGTNNMRVFRLFSLSLQVEFFPRVSGFDVKSWKQELVNVTHFFSPFKLKSIIAGA